MIHNKEKKTRDTEKDQTITDVDELIVPTTYSNFYFLNETKFLCFHHF